MIEFFDNQSNLDFGKLPNDSALVKIKALMNAYGCGYLFLSFWFQKSEQCEVTAAICRFESSVIINAADDADFEELSDFLNVISYGEIFCKRDLCSKLGLKIIYDCDELRFDGNAVNQNVSDDIGLSEVYDILKSGSDGQIDLPSYDDWYVDFSHRLRHGCARICAVSNHAVAVTAYETGTEAIISGVATKPEYRGKGYAKLAVLAICNSLETDGKVPIILAVGSMMDYYTKLGFKKTGKFAVAKIN